MGAVQRLIAGIAASEFYKNIIGLFSGIFAARLIPALFAVLLARLYAPEDFGDFVLFLSIASLLSIFVNGGYEGAVILTEESSQRGRIFRFSLRLNLFLNGFFLAAIIVSLLVFGRKSVNAFLWMMVPFYAFFFGGVQLIRNVMISTKQFKKLALLEIIRAAATGILQSLLFLWPDTGLFLGVILAQGVTFFSFIFLMPEASLFRVFRCSRPEFVLARRYRNFPLYSVPAEFFNYLSNQLPVFMIKPFFGQVKLGLYSFSHRYLNTPVQLTSISIGSVYIQKARSLKEKMPVLAGLTFSLYRKQLWLAILPFTLLALWGKEIFAFIFGNEWAYSGSLAQILSPWLFMVFISSPLSTILIAMEKQKISMIFNISLLVGRFLVLAAGGFILKDLTSTIILYSLTGFLFFLFLGACSLRLAGVAPVKAAFELCKAIVFVVLPLILIRIWLWNAA